MSVFQVGYAEVNINPPLGIGIAGYYIPRFVKGFLDDLKASALALSLGDTKVLLISVDNEGITKPLADKFRAAISERAEIPGENVFLSVSHTHTGPLVEPTDAFPAPEAPIAWYQDFMARRLGDVAALALADLKPGKMGFAVGTAPDRIAYIRRYKMKDGTTMTCPPVGDPNIDHPIGTLDQRVNVLRFDREGAESVVLVNYGLHADTINGELISADFPGWMRRTVEKVLDGTKCVFFNGAEGDTGADTGRGVGDVPGEMEEVLQKVLVGEGVAVAGNDLVSGNAGLLGRKTVEIPVLQCLGAAVREKVGYIVPVAGGIGIAAGEADTCKLLLVDPDEIHIGALNITHHIVGELVCGCGGLIPGLGCEILRKRSIGRNKTVAGKDLVP